MPAWISLTVGCPRLSGTIYKPWGICLGLYIGYVAWFQRFFQAQLMTLGYPPSRPRLATVTLLRARECTAASKGGIRPMVFG